MNEDTIRRYAKLMDELNLSGLEFQEDGVSLKLKKKINPERASEDAFLPPAQPAKPNEVVAGFRVHSPMVGVFYAAPAENAEPFVKVGSRVSKGDTLCIIEAMKLMNEVTCEKDGIVSEICVNNGDAVEYGTVLFVIGD